MLSNSAYLSISTSAVYILHTGTFYIIYVSCRTHTSKAVPSVGNQGLAHNGISIYTIHTHTLATLYSLKKRRICPSCQLYGIKVLIKETR
ncbi:hypothetical protein XENTR_v10024724 [Xenopus tropicalis]|nr:hypothetical protein XENTR_v10024724 [Xenopus tropicalis]